MFAGVVRDHICKMGDAKMAVQIQYDFDLEGDDREPLRTALGCTDAELDAKLALHAKAALSEYVEAYLGRRAFTRGSDMLEHRLALLIEHAFAGALPLEVEVSRLFQTPVQTSRGLLRNTLSKYSYQLRDATAASARALLEDASWDPAKAHFRLKIRSSNMLATLNQALADTDAAKKPVMRLPDSVATYEVSSAAYDMLCQLFGAQAVAQA